jgi:hypothetical protein
MLYVFIFLLLVLAILVTIICIIRRQVNASLEALEDFEDNGLCSCVRDYDSYSTSEPVEASNLEPSDSCDDSTESDD